jgi:hypothetical protein
MVFSTSTVLHCTNVAHGYNNIGISYSAKCNVQKKKPQYGLKRSYHSLKIVSIIQYFIIVVFQFFCNFCCV